MIGRVFRVFGYGRVSSREQGLKGTSLEGQGDTFKRYCAANALPPPIIRIEVESAAAENIDRRAELAALLREVRAGDLVLVTALDRWSRDIVHAVASIRALVARGVRWYSITENIDASTPHGDSELGIRAWVADNERKRIRERTVGRRAALKDQGFYVEGPSPFGTRRGPRAQRLQLTLTEEPSEAALVREAFERAQTQTLAAVIDWLEVETERPWDKKSVWSLLRNRVYLGEVPSGAGGWIRSSHVPALITLEAFEAVQRAMSARRTQGPAATKRTLHWLLRGLGSCPDCGARMGANFGHEPAPWGWYVCGARLRRGTCSAPWARVRIADAVAGEAALDRVRQLRAELAEDAAEERRQARSKDTGPIRSRLLAARDRAVRLCVDGTITAEDLAREQTRIAVALEKLSAADARTSEGPSPAPRGALAHLSAIERAWARAPTVERREILSMLASRIVITSDRVVIDWRSSAELAESVIASATPSPLRRAA